MTANATHDRSILQGIAHRAMVDRGLLPDFSPQVQSELARLVALPAVALAGAGPIQDLRSLAWASIDNDHSRDLDQLTVAEALTADAVRIRVAVADVDSRVPRGSAIDDHARQNTTSVYTAAQIFPMLPERLSTDLTSLNFQEDRLAIVIAMEIAADGTVRAAELYRAQVRNQAKLAYNSLAAWLEGGEALPTAVAAVPGLEANLRLQNQAAQRMKKLRHAHGALSLETAKASPVFEGDQIRALETETRNGAKDLIEDFMIAANGVTARYQSAQNFPSIRRVVRTPKRWERIVQIAGAQGFPLPETPDPKALEAFLTQAKTADPAHFSDLSLTIVKLLGAGEYVAEAAGADSPGHFGLAAKDYAHATAPNRRYADLVTQRLVKAALQAQPCPYTLADLEALAQHCTAAENAANKVERQVEKSAAALLMQSRIGERFEALVTGASAKGTWVRILPFPVEGKLTQGFESLDVGDHLQVQLLAVNIERGLIDFKRIGS